MENNENHATQKSFKITIETRGENYVKIGGAPEVRVIECDGYFLSCCRSETEADGKKTSDDGCTVCQGMMNVGLIAEGIHEVDDVMGVRVERQLHLMNGPEGDLMDLLKEIICGGDEDGEREAD